MAQKELLSLCEFLSGVNLTSIPVSIVEHARLVLLDTLGVIIGGSHTREVDRIAGEVSLNSGEGKTAACPGREELFHPLNAALVGGISGSSLEYEEGNSRAMGHPAIQIVPAVVAAGESENLTAESVLSGLIAGYEAASRVSRASSMKKGLHPTGTWGVVGCALGTGCVYGKNPEALAEIANIASSFALTPYVKNSFAGKNVATTFAGLTNYLGLLANLFFDSGIRADPGSLNMAFSQVVSDKFDPESLNEDLGKAYAIAENYFKPYPTCRFTHPSLDALETILAKKKINPDEVDCIKVSSFKAAVHTSSKPPANAEAMRFSTPYLVAVMLLHGKIEIGTLTDDLLQDPRVDRLAGKVEMIYSSEYERSRPERNSASVTVRLKDGRELTHEVLYCRGDPLNPMSGKAVSDKFLSLAGPVLGTDRAERFLEKFNKLESGDHMQPLIASLRHAGGARG